MSVVDRVLEIIDYKGISKNKFYKDTKLSNGFLDKVKDIGSSKVEYILNSYPDINPIWLITGEGEMVRQKANGIKNRDFTLMTDRNVESQLIPLYHMEATAGLVPLFENMSAIQAVDYISIPNLSKCDGALFVTGDSMYPILKSGDIVAFKRLLDFENDIFWGEMYLISVEVSGEEYISVKYIQKSDKGDDYIKLVSHNKNHNDKDVKLSKVRALAYVKASIRINSMQ